jgi:hypothetical protein
MSIKQDLFTSFIKGVGKTVGTVAVVGILSTIFYVYSNKQNCYKKNNDNNDIIMEETETEVLDQEVLDQEVLDQEVLDQEDLDQEDQDDQGENLFDTKYKLIFDKLLN